MTPTPTSPPRFTLLASLLLGLLPGLFATDLPRAPPEAVGMSTERLKTMHHFVESSVESYPLTGAVTLVARHGKLVDLSTYGYQDILKKTPMSADGIFALASMTKTIVSAGAMVLVEQGKIRPADPISKFLPEFKKPRVFVRTDADGQTVTRPATSPILVRHLLTHTAGWPANGKGAPDLASLYAKDDFRNASSLADLVTKLSALPLQDDPGTAYVYGPAIDVLGALIERVSGLPLESFLQQHLFEPLDMQDTFFEVPLSKRDRLVSMFSHQNGELVYAVRSSPHGDSLRAYPSGGGGLYSTISDYFRFAQMLLDHGTYEGRSVLGKMTVKSMMRNQTGFLGDGIKSNNRSEAYGYGGSVKIDTFYEKDMTSVGSYGWGGAFSTWYRIDPAENLIVMFFTQHYPMSSRLMPPFANTALQAIIE
jgi:CubicO group peptidase (beta-lactamase class C family)